MSLEAQLAEAGSDATLVVMYHYVRPPDPRYGGIVPLSPGQFRHQLEWLTRHCEVVDPESPQLLAPGRGDRPRAVITFDDGTRDQYDHAFPILRAMGLPAAVACISGPALLGSVPTVHLVHLLLSHLGAQGLWAELLSAGVLPDPFPRDQATKAYYYESDADRACVKFALNFLLEPVPAQRLAADIYARTVGPVQQLARDWYLTDGQIREMAAAGIRFATHAQRHLPLYGPLEQFVAEEIAPCEAWLTGLLGRPPLLYAAAFGGGPSGALSLESLQPLLQARGYRQTYTTRPGLNRNGGFFVERIDCNRLPLS